MPPARSCASSGRCCRKTRSAAPISRPRSPKNHAAEIEAILRGVWDNLGRVGAEFANLDRLWDFNVEHPERGRIQVDPSDVERFRTLAEDGKPALIFAAHLANWELPAISAPTYKLDSAVLYRRPNIARHRSNGSPKRAPPSWAN